MELHKEKLLNSVRVHIDSTRKKIQEKLEDVRFLANRTLAQFSKLAPEDQMAQMHITLNAQARLEELVRLESSPYFMKCDIINEEGKHKTYFFGKHEFTENSIYSWIAPIAAIRFENPGVTSFKLPTGEIKPVTIKQKEQYMIVDGKILFFAIESQNNPRELIYQEHFTKQKSEFALPEIVAQMEKAQDQVIRASHKGSLVIGGPAGSGKTTLALHRVAYLTQAPETSEFYPTKSIIVFVQDIGTKNYFSTLLPGLGIHDIQITTFSEWAFSILGLNGYQYHERYGSTDEEKDLYEYHKIRALREGSFPAWSENIFGTLFSQYKSYFSKNDLALFNKQKEDKTLDRFDITILLMSYFQKYQKFETVKTYQTCTDYYPSPTTVGHVFLHRPSGF
jgi:DNA helicase IV